MAITETYVDPAIAGASGAGTVGDPYGDLQHALDTMTRDSTNGDRINIKAGTDEILGAALTLATYGTPTIAAQLFFQGYTTAAGDGGIGGISGDGSYSVFDSSSLDYVSFIDLHLHNCGGNQIVRVDQGCLFYNVEFDNSTTHGLYCGKNTTIIACYFHNIGGYGIFDIGGARITYCTLENGANDFNAAAVYLGAETGMLEFNIISIDGSTDGVLIGNPYNAVNHNTIYSASGTGQGIIIPNDVTLNTITNNYVEGFSGAGGIGIDINTGVNHILRGNRYYNNTTNLDDAGIWLIKTDNSATAASALTNPGAGDFSVGTDLKAGAYPTSFKGTSTNQYMDIGAAQRREQAIVIAGRHNVLLRR